MEEEQRIDRGAVAPIKMVAGNKCDLQRMRQVKANEGLDWARRRNCGFMETSAREMVNIEETFARTLYILCQDHQQQLIFRSHRSPRHGSTPSQSRRIHWSFSSSYAALDSTKRKSGPYEWRCFSIITAKKAERNHTIPKESQVLVIA